MASVARPTRPETERIFFELDQFEVTGEDRIEVRGRWFGVRGRRFMRPTLMLHAGGTQHRALADLEHKPWFAEDGEPWEASFSCDVEGGEVREVELSVAPDIAVPLPAPSARRRNPTRIAAQGERRPGTPRGRSVRGEPRRDDISIARQEIERLRAELEVSNAARLEANGERDHARAERDELAAERDRAVAERQTAVAARDQLRRELAREQSARDEADTARAQADAAREEAQATYARLAEARDQALNERSAALAERAEMARRLDTAGRSREEALRRHEQALSERERLQSELDAQRHAVRGLQAEREAELATRGAAMVMRGARRAAPVKADWTTRGIAIAVLVIAVLAALLIIHAI